MIEACLDHPIWYLQAESLPCSSTDASGTDTSTANTAINPDQIFEFWQKKFKDNVTRDERVGKELEALGWNVAVIWQCETAGLDALAGKLKDIMGS